MNSRTVAVQVLCRVLTDGQSLTAALENELEKVGDKQARAFIQALCYGVIRDYQGLEFLSGLLMDKPIRAKDTDIQVLILLGLYQLRSMRVKTHAVVAETVAAVGKKRWAKGLVNAVLRQYLRDKALLDAKLDSNLEVSSLHPRWLLEAISQNWTEQTRQIIQYNNQQPPLTLRVNLNHVNPDDYCRLLAEHGIVAHPLNFSDTAVQLKQPVAVEELPQFAAGWVSVQDAAAQFAAPLLDVQAGQRVLDLCAAPGGKTCAILETQPDLAQLVAVDIDEKRLQKVRENLQRLAFPSGENSVTLLTGDAAQPELWWDGRLFDRILLDAPCSATGVIRRHPDIKLLRRADDIISLQSTQKEILTAAWRLLKSGGILLYATCSILKAENEQQMSAFLASHADSFEIPITSEWGQPCTVGRQILTGDFEMDGFYYARLGKK
jgi:16S rRNA (cytosine967-C5)-methyltransferase